jgi:hypothetical protein
MKLYLDTANVKEIQEAATLGVLNGVTTNPYHPRVGTCWRCQSTSLCTRRRSPAPNEEYFMLSSRIFHVERL